jgi:hypothetical protein
MCFAFNWKQACSFMNYWLSTVKQIVKGINTSFVEDDQMFLINLIVVLAMCYEHLGLGTWDLGKCYEHFSIIYKMCEITNCILGEFENGSLK